MSVHTTSGTPRYKRILLKLSGEALQKSPQGPAFDAKELNRSVDQICKVHELGIEMAIVVGGGNILRGEAAAAAGIGRTEGDHMGMLATVINALTLRAALEARNVESRVMTAYQIRAVAEPFVRRRALRHLERGRVVIFGAGTGNPYFTTDSAAALRAKETDCDVLLKATKVDGVYDRDPHVYPDAVRFDRISYQEAIERRLQVMDATAFALCMENAIPIVVFNFFTPDEIVRVVRGEPVGTEVGT